MNKDVGHSAGPVYIFPWVIYKYRTVALNHRRNLSDKIPCYIGCVQINIEGGINGMYGLGNGVIYISTHHIYVQSISRIQSNISITTYPLNKTKLITFENNVFTYQNGRIQYILPFKGRITWCRGLMDLKDGGERQFRTGGISIMRLAKGLGFYLSEWGFDSLAHNPKC